MRKKYPSTPIAIERVRKGLKAKRLKGKMLYTENERVRKRMKTKEGFFGERAGINTEIAEVAGNTEESQCRGGPPPAGGGGGVGGGQKGGGYDIFIKLVKKF